MQDARVAYKRLNSDTRIKQFNKKLNEVRVANAYPNKDLVNNLFQMGVPDTKH